MQTLCLTSAGGLSPVDTRVKLLDISSVVVGYCPTSSSNFHECFSSKDRNMRRKNGFKIHSTLQWASSMFLILLLSSVLAKTKTKTSPKTKMSMKFYDFKACENVVHYFRLTKVNYRMVDGADVIDADGYVDVDVKYIKMMIVQLHRCLGGVGANQCEYFTRLSWTTSLCELAAAKNMVWTPLVDKITPTFKCPYRAGFHQARNATFDLSSFENQGFRLPWEKYIWKVHCQVINELDQIAFCFNGTVEVRRVLVRKES